MTDDKQTPERRTYRVIRYENQWPLGSIEHVIGTHLSLDEAEKLADENDTGVPREQVVVQEEPEDERGFYHQRKPD